MMTEQVRQVQRRTLEQQATARVSFILVTKNRSQIIANALDMARKLMGPEDELIVVDGASTDGTTEIIAGYDDLVDLLVSEPDTSPTHALNKGILAAHGRYIKQITDDDQLYPEALRQAIQVMEAHQEIDVLVCGGTREIDNKVSNVYVPEGANYGKSPEDVFKYGACGVGFIMRRSSFPHTGLFNSAGTATDGEFIATAIYNHANVKFCRINLFHHPIYSHSFIVSQRRTWERDMDRLAKQYCSPGFYVKYRVKNAILRNPLLGKLALSARDTFRTGLAGLTGKQGPKSTSPAEVLWDGGFS